MLLFMGFIIVLGGVLFAHEIGHKLIYWLLGVESEVVLGIVPCVRSKGEKEIQWWLGKHQILLAFTGIFFGVLFGGIISFLLSLFSFPEPTLSWYLVSIIYALLLGVLPNHSKIPSDIKQIYLIFSKKLLEKHVNKDMFDT